MPRGTPALQSTLQSQRALAERGPEGSVTAKFLSEHAGAGRKPWGRLRQTLRPTISFLPPESGICAEHFTERWWGSWLWEARCLGAASWEWSCTLTGGLRAHPSAPWLNRQSQQVSCEIHWNWNASEKPSAFNVLTIFSEKLFSWKILDWIFLEDIIWVN